MNQSILTPIWELEPRQIVEIPVGVGNPPREAPHTAVVIVVAGGSALLDDGTTLAMCNYDVVSVIGTQSGEIVISDAAREMLRKAEYPEDFEVV